MSSGLCGNHFLAQDLEALIVNYKFYAGCVALWVFHWTLSTGIAADPAFSVELVQRAYPRAEVASFQLIVKPDRPEVDVRAILRLANDVQRLGRIPLQRIHRDSQGNTVMFNLSCLSDRLAAHSDIYVLASKEGSGEHLGSAKVLLRDAKPRDRLEPIQRTTLEPESSSRSNTAAEKVTALKDSWERFAVGDQAPDLPGYAADGSVYDVKESLLGKVVLVSFWSVDDEDYEKAVRRCEQIFRKHRGRSDFQIVSFWTDEITSFLQEMNHRGSDFYGRRHWWPMSYIRSQHKTNDQFRIREQDIRTGRTPVFFLLDKDFHFSHVDIPMSELEETVGLVLRGVEPVVPARP